VNDGRPVGITCPFLGCPSCRMPKFVTRGFSARS